MAEQEINQRNCNWLQISQRKRVKRLIDSHTLRARRRTSTVKGLLRKGQRIRKTKRLSGDVTTCLPCNKLNWHTLAAPIALQLLNVRVGNDFVLGGVVEQDRRFGSLSLFLTKNILGENLGDGGFGKKSRAQGLVLRRVDGLLEELDQAVGSAVSRGKVEELLALGGDVFINDGTELCSVGAGLGESRDGDGDEAAKGRVVDVVEHSGQVGRDTTSNPALDIKLGSISRLQRSSPASAQPTTRVSNAQNLGRLGTQTNLATVVANSLHRVQANHALQQTRRERRIGALVVGRRDNISRKKIRLDDQQLSRDDAVLERLTRSQLIVEGRVALGCRAIIRSLERNEAILLSKQRLEDGRHARNRRSIDRRRPIQNLVRLDRIRNESQKRGNDPAVLQHRSRSLGLKARGGRVERVIVRLGNASLNRQREDIGRTQEERRQEERLQHGEDGADLESS